MTGQDAFGQGLREIIDIDDLSKSAEGRSSRYRARAGAGNRMAAGAQLLRDRTAFPDEVIASAGLHRAEQHGHAEQGCDRDPMRRSSPGSACPSLLLHCEPIPIVRGAGLRTRKSATD